MFWLQQVLVKSVMKFRSFVEAKVWKKEILDNQETKDIANKPPKQLV